LVDDDTGVVISNVVPDCRCGLQDRAGDSTAGPDLINIMGTNLMTARCFRVIRTRHLLLGWRARRLVISNVVC
jgi:hypothetical protein